MHAKHNGSSHDPSPLALVSTALCPTRSTGDIGTGGALIRGVYSPESSLQPEESGYSWVRNGPNVLPDGAVVFDSCGDCRLGFGVRDMSVAALPGTGFKAVQLSQLFADTRCEGSGVNSDGLMWTGMKYKCAEVSNA